MEGLQSVWLSRHLDPALGRVLVAGSRIYEGRPSMHARYLGRRITGVDMQPGDGVDLVADLERPQPKLAGRFGHVDCCSVLEHSRAPWLMADVLTDCLKLGGTILLSVPFVWRVHAYPSDYWRFTREAIPVLFPRIEWRVVEYVSDRIGGNRVPASEVNEHPYLARCEIMAFGVKRDGQEG